MSWNKPLPQPTPISTPFWDGLKAHAVRIQQCEHGHWLFFPRTHCPTCGSRQLTWKTVSGEGTLYTFTVARVPTLPEFSDEMPQLLAVVELDQGVHINTTLVGVAPEELRVGQRVRPVFDERPGSVTLLRYTPVESAQASVITGEKTTETETAPAAATEAPKRQVSCKDIDAMRALVSQEFSAWSNQFEVTQELINQFAALSGDDYWIHTDPEKARAQGPFGTTIAHGSLVQVLTSQLKMPMDFEVTDFTNIVNYGSDRLRFATPVPSGCRIHGRYRIKSVEQLKRGVQVVMEINIHCVGQDRPSVINDLVMLYM
ncbi:OB-fold domain-containing protein [Simplicispira psychrophila]|uniref:bifunctional OB-fold nucleic acid binding domain-containing protein/MaoC family dehydratase n=1 Tax=Simplicispira psychrophila TaxID=80882 RepID=UPI0004811AA9|nr:OB-fold domain-containing protein [Simplicispira psychrophila]